MIAHVSEKQFFYVLLQKHCLVAPFSLVYNLFGVCPSLLPSGFEVEIGLVLHYSNGHLCLKCLLVIYSLIKQQH